MYTKKIFSSLSLTLISFLACAQESAPITITFINRTNNRVRATFHDVTALMQAALYNEHSDDDEPVIHIIDYSYYLPANNNPQKIVLIQKQLGTRNMVEGILDLTTAHSCTLSFFDSQTREKKGYTFSLKDDVTVIIHYVDGDLEIEQIPS